MPALQVGKVVDGIDCIGDVAATRPEELCGDHRHIPVDTCNTETVSADGTDRPCNVGAVGIVPATVVDAVVVVGEVPAVNVVDVAVAVIVSTVCRIKGIRPNVRRKIGMGDINTFVDDADIDGRGADLTLCPRFVRTRTVWARGAAGWSAHPPETGVAVERIVRIYKRGDSVVGLNKSDAWLPPELLNRGGNACTRAERNDFGRTRSSEERANVGGTDRCAHGRAPGVRQTRLKTHDDSAWHVWLGEVGERGDGLQRARAFRGLQGCAANWGCRKAAGQEGGGGDNGVDQPRGHGLILLVDMKKGAPVSRCPLPTHSMPSPRGRR